MFKNTYFFPFAILLLLSAACLRNAHTATAHKLTDARDSTALPPQLTVLPGASSVPEYLPLLRGKRIALVTNQTGIIPQAGTGKYIHLADSLLHLGIDIRRIFSPEHGFRGTAGAGEEVRNGIDSRTGIPIVSLYGVHKKPKPGHLKDIDLIVFDIQDVGVRFYTYISTLHYVMEAVAQQGIPLIVLDRPNPNARYIDGPVLKDELRSFVGLHPVPIVYGMTIGEYARMINGEGWLQGGVSCLLTVIPVTGYDHRTRYSLPVKPSPNLPNDKAIELYPSLCLFEGTAISCGRGTDFPFQIFGAPDLPSGKYPFAFTPQPDEGAPHPKFAGRRCHGLDLRKENPTPGLNLQWILDAYKDYPDKGAFFNGYFDRLAGDRELKEQIKLGYSQDDIKKTWQPALDDFKLIRAKYLLYD